MRLLFIFLDGVGLGTDDPNFNPFSRAKLPTLRALLGGRSLLRSSAPYEGETASLLALDAGLGVPGLPQSATGQAVLLTGVNVPARIGEHYGPKPNPIIADLLREENLFSRLMDAGRSVALLNAYPPRYFDAVESGHRLYSSIPLAATAAGVRLFNKEDFYEGRALSADFTGEGWRTVLGFPDAPLLSPEAAGARLGTLAGAYDFSLFEYWSTDYAGHKQDMTWAVDQLEAFDLVLRGFLRAHPEGLLTLVTSDHGNIEDLSTRRHTLAAVPALLIGPLQARRRFASGLRDIADIAPAIEAALRNDEA